jgi:hypothetical protein
MSGAKRPLTTAQIEQRRKAAKARTTKKDVIVSAPEYVAKAMDLALNRAVEQQVVPELAPPTNGIQSLVGAYVLAWQARYKTKARPAVTKAIGVFKLLLRERSVAEITELLQVYCQMNDPWFQTKSHDVVTFGENIGKIAIARDKGHERPNGEKHWTEIYAERIKKGDERDGQTIRNADQSTQLTMATDVRKRT